MTARDRAVEALAAVLAECDELAFANMHADWARESVARTILASPALRDLLSEAWDEGWDEYDNYAGGTGVPEPPRENPYRADREVQP